MQQFTVPQFIDVENKIIGPITTRQFIIILTGAIIIAISYKLADFSLFVTTAVVVLVLVAAFAFVKINGRPFHLFVLNVVQTWRRPNLRVWRKVVDNKDTKTHLNATTPGQAKTVPVKAYHKSRLAELALIVDTKGRYQG